MTKKKPDFLRDLDTAIMDELTGGGIKGNAAGLVGTLTQISSICDDMHSKSGVDNNSASMDIAVYDMEKGA